MTQAPTNRRRNLLKGAAVAAGAMAAPMVAVAQTASFRFQSTWPAKDIFHEYANDFASKVNAMAGGRLNIEVLPSGAVVPAFQLLEAVNKGTLDGGHGVHLGREVVGVLVEDVLRRPGALEAERRGLRDGDHRGGHRAGGCGGFAGATRQPDGGGSCAALEEIAAIHVVSFGCWPVPGQCSVSKQEYLSSQRLPSRRSDP